MVPDFSRVKSAELSPRAKRECINKEWCQTLVWSRVQSWQRGIASTKSGARLWWGQERRAEPAGNGGVNKQRVVSDSGRVKSVELSPRERGSASTKSGFRLWWGQERRADPTGKVGLHQQRVVPDFGRVKSAELSPRAMEE